MIAQIRLKAFGVENLPRGLTAACAPFHVAGVRMGALGWRGLRVRAGLDITALAFLQ